MTIPTHNDNFAQQRMLRNIMVSALVSIACIAIPIAFVEWLSQLKIEGTLLLLGLFVIYLSYFGYLWFLHNKIITFIPNEWFALIILYIFVSAMVVGQFAYCFQSFNLVVDSDGFNSLSFSDSVYFSTTTFTTLGFGDFKPSNMVGRYFAAGEAMLGTLHMVIFVAIFLSKLSPTHAMNAK